LFPKLALLAGLGGFFMVATCFMKGVFCCDCGVGETFLSGYPFVWYLLSDFTAPLDLVFMFLTG
jgi:hypothetical protein